MVPGRARTNFRRSCPRPPAELAPLTDAERAATFFASHGVTEHGGTRFHGVSIPRCQQMLVLALTSLDVAEALAG